MGFLCTALVRLLTRPQTVYFLNPGRIRQKQEGCAGRLCVLLCLHLPSSCPSGPAAEVLPDFNEKRRDFSAVGSSRQLQRGLRANLSIKHRIQSNKELGCRWPVLSAAPVRAPPVTSTHTANTIPPGDWATEPLFDLFLTVFLPSAPLIQIILIQIPNKNF